MLTSSMILEEIYVNTDLLKAKVMACVTSLNINFIEVINCQFVVHLIMKNLSEICGYIVYQMGLNWVAKLAIPELK